MVSPFLPLWDIDSLRSGTLIVGPRWGEADAGVGVRSKKANRTSDRGKGISAWLGRLVTGGGIVGAKDPLI